MSTPTPQEQQLRNLAVEWASTADDLRRLAAWLIEQAAIMEATQDAPVIERPGREVVERRRYRGMWVQREKVRCGKATCKCAHGAAHGPYWYAYWSEGGKMRSKYIGKRLPDEQEATPDISQARAPQSGTPL